MPGCCVSPESGVGGPSKYHASKYNTSTASQWASQWVAIVSASAYLARVCVWFRRCLCYRAWAAHCAARVGNVRAIPALSGFVAVSRSQVLCRRSRGSRGTIDSHRTHVRIESVSVYLALRRGGASVRVYLPDLVVCSVVACAAGAELFACAATAESGQAMELTRN